MIAATVEELTPLIGTRPACRALGASPATIYRRRRPPEPRPRRPRPTPERALTEPERKRVLEVLHSERFVDVSPEETWATLLDEGTYLCSTRTMYRILAAKHGGVRERRDQLTHPAYAKPELLAEFAFDDDYGIGILSAFAHHAWLTAGWSTLEDRLRYTPSTVFATYPWPPAPSPAQRQAVAAASRDVMMVRRTLCGEHQVGLTRLYNHLDDGAFSALADRHRLLDRAVAAAYGWPAATSTEHPNTTNERLLALNFAIASGELSYTPF
jgi:hypothetical protein